ncbi:MAG: hypothetical protein ACYS7M_12560, partial [Planctomycetota bacterium]
TPVVLLGRYTTFAGNNIFYTLPINVVAFDSFEIFFWRGEMQGSFILTIEESLDQKNWTSLTSTDPGPQQEVTLTADITQPWLRATVEINGTAGTGYAYGYLTNRGA